MVSDPNKLKPASEEPPSTTTSNNQKVISEELPSTTTSDKQKVNLFKTTKRARASSGTLNFKVSYKIQS